MGIIFDRRENFIGRVLPDIHGPFSYWSWAADVISFYFEPEIQGRKRWLSKMMGVFYFEK